MSKFAVEVRTISQVIQHPNADRLTIYKVDGLGYQFISNVKYEVGDRVVYFPIDSVMPPRLIEAFELGTMLAGKEHNRVKTIRLRGQVSQGFVADLKSVIPLIEDNEKHRDLVALLQLATADLSTIDLTEVLGVTKYEPPAVPCQNGDLVPLPLGSSMYDIEGCDNFPDVVQWLIDQQIPVMVTEKLEGQNFSVTVTNQGEEFVSQRRFSIREKDGGEHDMWAVARREGWLDFAKKILQDLNADDVTLYGEHCGPGVQGNYYKLKEQHVFCFDLKVNGQWLSASEWLDVMNGQSFDPPTVPLLSDIHEGVLLDEWLDGRTLQQASNGKSKLWAENKFIAKERLREGIVIRPFNHVTHPFEGTIGSRLIIKQRDPVYLDKTGN